MPSTLIDYGTQRSRWDRLPRRTLLLAIAIIALAAFAVRFHLVGFNYRRVIDTQYTICPDQVVGQHEDVVTLATGEQLRIVGVPTPVISAALTEAAGHVRIDRTHNVILARKRCFSCGNRPEQGQIITIPLFAVETDTTYAEQEIGDVEPVPAGLPTGLPTLPGSHVP